MVRLIAITGGIGSGKSAFSKILRSRGYVVVDADQCVVEVLSQPKIVAAIKLLIGDSAYDSNGNYARDFVRGVVFSDSAKRSALEAIIHPAVREVLESLAQKVRIVAPGAWIFYEIPLLFELGREKDFDFVILVTASEEERIRRVIESRGLSESQIRSVILSQMPENDKRLAANYVVENDLTLRELEANAQLVTEHLRAIFSPSKN